MVVLEIIWMTAWGFLLIALVLWFGLLLTHAVTKRRDFRIQVHRDQWFDGLLDVMDGGALPPSLPIPASREEMEAVLGLLRELADQLRGSYGENMKEILGRIEASDFGLQLLNSYWSEQRIQGAALLAWCPSEPEGNQALEKALADKDHRVVLEASVALVKRRAVRDIVAILEALCRSRAAKSLISHDLFRRWGAEFPTDLEGLLDREWPEDAWLLLYEAAGASGMAELTSQVARGTRHPSPRVAISALDALAKFGDPDGAEACRQACSHFRPEVRRQAAQSLTSTGTPEAALPVLESLLSDDSFEVRRCAFHGILAMGGKSRLLALPLADEWQSELMREAGLIERRIS